MRLLSNMALVLGVLFANTAVAAERPNSEGAELILFGANWCAPCRAELTDLPALAAVLGERRLILAWLDSAPPLGAQKVPANVRILDRRAAQALFGTFAKINAGLPLAIMRDRRGVICAVVKERLHAPQLVALQRGCEA